MLLMAEIGIGVHVIVSSITFYVVAIMPFPGKRLLVATVISFCENGAEESKYRNLAEFMETYITGNITIAG